MPIAAFCGLTPLPGQTDVFCGIREVNTTAKDSLQTSVKGCLGSSGIREGTAVTLVFSQYLFAQLELYFPQWFGCSWE